MKKYLLLAISFVVIFAMQAQTYDESEKEGLRNILRQKGTHYHDPTYPYTTTNFEINGLTETDTMAWYSSEEWVSKIGNITWNGETPKRIIKFSMDRAVESTSYDLSPFTELEDLSCSSIKYAMYTHAVSYDVSKNTKIKNLSVFAWAETTYLTGAENLVNIEYLYLHGASLDISSFPLLKEFSTNKSVEGVDFSKNPLLEKLSVSSSMPSTVTMKELDLSQNNNLCYVNCSETGLEKLILPDTPTLQSVSCLSNKLKFSTLPLLTIENYFYSPQMTDYMYDENTYTYTLKIGEELDLSSEHLIDGIISEYTFYGTLLDPNGLTTVDGINTENGKIIVTDSRFIGNRIICAVSNDRFPQFKMTYFLDIVTDASNIEENTINNQPLRLQSSVVSSYESIVLESNSEASGVACLYNMWGQTVAGKSKIRQGTTEIPAPASIGVYLLRVKMDDGNGYSFKVLVR